MACLLVGNEDAGLVQLLARVVESRGNVLQTCGLVAASAKPQPSYLLMY